ncbi:MAG: hypothetical protein U9Q81_25870 [Pseudomonadota bacterium]|nr:hypothetical protein [Pseudomonadota bacterium]
MKPIREGDMLGDAVTALTSMRDNLDRVYYQGVALDSRSINAVTGQGDFEELKSWAADFGGGA